MHILLSCSKETLNNLINVLKIVNLVKVIIPIILIIYSIIKLLRSKELNKVLITKFIIMMLVSLLIFCLPNIIFLFNKYLNNNELTCASLIDKNVINTIDILNKPIDSLNKNDYEEAYKYYNDIKSDIIKKELINDVENLKYTSGYENISLKIKELIENYKDSFDNDIYNEIMNLFNKLDDKDKIEDEINNLKKYQEVINGITSLSSNYNKDKYRELSSKIDEINDEDIKSKLKDKLIKSRNLPKINLSSGVTLENANGNMPYLMAVSENPTEEMPLIIFLHGDWGGGIIKKLTETTDYIYENVMKKLPDSFLFIAPTVNGYNARDYNWQTPSIVTSLKGFIDKIVSEYKIDKEKVIIMGHSRGAVGVWDIVSRFPNYFSIAIPVSCGGTSFKAESFKNTKVWGFVGGIGDETRYRNSMRKYVKEINAIGGVAKLDEYPNKSHGEMGGILLDIDLYKWILEQ